MTWQEITLRPARQSDESFLLDLRKQVMTEHLTRVGEPTDDDAHLQRVRYRYTDAQIVLIDDVCAGLMKVYRTAQEWVLVQIQILPQFQRQGIGQHLLRSLLQDAKQHGVAVRLSVLRGNPARRLYEQLGFCMMSETDNECSLVFRA